MHEALSAEINQIAALARGGRTRDALERARDLAARHHDDAAAWRFYAHVAASTGAYSLAIKAFQSAIACAATDTDLQLELAQAAIASDHRRIALEAVNAAARLAPMEAVKQDTIGTVFTFCEEPAKALDWFDRACAAQPNNPHFLFNLASAQRMCGNSMDAEQTLERLLAVAPGDGRAHLMRADLRRQTATNNHVAEALRALESARGRPYDEIALCYTLAKALEDIGEHARSFSFLARGARLQCAHAPCSIDEELAAMKRLIERQDAEALTADGCRNDDPIFVIGLPRSGTTLVERILTSHPAIGAIGEAPAFPVVVRDALEAQLGRLPSLIETADLGLSLDPKTLGQSYLEETRPQTGARARFVDKMLTNHLNVGLISRALPNARIIVVRREPADACYAMFKSYLTGRYAFTASLRDVARYFAAWTRLMDHWRQALGSRLLEVRYEDLVTDPEPAIRALISFAGVDWDDRCLAFHQSDAAVTSASAAQVRQPLYTSSVGKWRAYREELGELVGALAAEGVSVA